MVRDESRKATMRLDVAVKLIRVTRWFIVLFIIRCIISSFPYVLAVYDHIKIKSVVLVNVLSCPALQQHV